MNSFWKISLVLFLLPFVSKAKSNCDTLCASYKAEVRCATSLDSFGFDSTQVAWRFHNPEGYLFVSKLESDDNNYRLVFREGKKWRSWVTTLSDDIEFGTVFCSWKDVDGKGKSDLVIWALDVFGHHCATHAEERTSYTVEIWNVETATFIFSFNYKTSEWEDDIDYPVEDSTGKRIAPPYETNEYSELSISTKAINIHTVSNLHDTTDVYMTKDYNENIDTLDPKTFCPPAEGTYIYQNGYWIHSNLPMKNHSLLLHPPDYHPYWELFILVPDQPLLNFFRRLFY